MQRLSRAVPQLAARCSALGARGGLVGRQPRATARRPAAMAGLLLCLTAALAVGQAGAEVYMKETFGGESLDGCRREVDVWSRWAGG
jgi:hypothetical protein